jgi:hypothetical protein
MTKVLVATKLIFACSWAHETIHTYIDIYDMPNLELFACVYLQVNIIRMILTRINVTLENFLGNF